MMTPCCGISSWRWRFCSTRRRCCCCWPRRRQGVDHGYGQERRSGPCRRMVEAPALDQAHVLETASQGGKARDRKGTEGVNKELAKKIADEGEYMPGPEEWNDLCALENAGMVETP